MVAGGSAPVTPVESCPRRRAMASNSSKKRRHGREAVARANRSRTAASDAPMYLLRSSGPLTDKNGSAFEASAEASSVLLQPGGPYSSTLERRRSGAQAKSRRRVGSSTASVSARFACSRPPTAARPLSAAAAGAAATTSCGETTPLAQSAAAVTDERIAEVVMQSSTAPHRHHRHVLRRGDCRGRRARRRRARRASPTDYISWQHPFRKIRHVKVRGREAHTAAPRAHRAAARRQRLRWQEQRFVEQAGDAHRRVQRAATATVATMQMPDVGGRALALRSSATASASPSTTPPTPSAWPAAGSKSRSSSTSIAARGQPQHTAPTGSSQARPLA